MSYTNHLWRALKCSLCGIIDTFRTEKPFQMEVAVLIFAIPAAFYLSKSRLELAVMIGSVLLVPVIELLNSALESAVDHTSTEIHPMAKKAKDAGSAAVFLAAVNAAIIWVVILL